MRLGILLRPPQPRYRVYTRLRSYSSVLKDVATGRSRSGGDVARLEADLCRAVGAKHAVAVSQARVAIYLTIRALVEQRKKIVMSPYTIYDVVNMVVSAGGIPVFADLSPGTCNISADEAKALIDDSYSVRWAANLAQDKT